MSSVGSHRRGFALAVLLSLTGVAAAQPNQHGAEAEQLFRDGKQHMKDGHFAEACKAFAASQELEPSTGTLMNLADCREKNGQLASAWGLFLEVERTTRSDAASAALNTTARQRAGKIEPRLSYLTISVPKESDIDGLRLTRNDEEVGEATWNRAIPIDGGSYVITGHAPGHEPWSTTVTVPAEQGHISVDVPRFKEAARLMNEGRDGGEPAGEPSRFTPRRKVAIGAATVGAIALGAGIALGVQAKGFESDAFDACPSNPCGANATRGNELGDKAEQRALLANIGYGTAAVAVGAAAVLWLTGAPRRVTVSPSASATTARLDLMVRF